jgi:hypothetical protein
MNLYEGNICVKVIERKMKQDWAVFLEKIVRQHTEVDRITIVQESVWQEE